MTFSIRDTHKEEEENDVPLHKLLWEDAKRFSFTDLVRAAYFCSSWRQSKRCGAIGVADAHGTLCNSGTT